MRKIFVQGAGSRVGATPGALRGAAGSPVREKYFPSEGKIFPQLWKCISSVWLLPALAVLSMLVARDSMGGNLSLALLSVAAVHLTVMLTLSDWRKEGGR